MDFIHAGVKSDPMIKSRKVLNEASKWDLSAENSRYFPSVDLNSIAAHNYRFDTKNNANTIDISLTLTQPLFDKSIGAGIKIAKSKYDLDKLAYKLALQESIKSIINNYLTALELQKILKNILIQKDFIEEHLLISEKKNQLGRTTSIDVDLVRARQKTVQANLMLAQEDYQTAVRQLELSSNLQIKNKLNAPNIKFEAKDFKDLEGIIAKHPQSLILEARAQLELASVNQEKAKSYPRIGAFASLESTQLDLDRRRGAIGLQLDYDIYQGGRVNSRTESAILRAQSSQILHNNFNKKSTSLLKLALDKYQFALKHKNIVAQANSAYMKILQNRKIQFKVGSVSTTEVLQAQEVLFDSAQKLSEITIKQANTAIEILAISGMLNLRKLKKYLGHGKEQ
ncbi:MAG: TolC family protein [Oligoflexales bacterium]